MRVRRGDIFHRFFQTTNPPKSKFFVIVGENEDNFFGFFFINSNINRFVAQSAEMSQMQFPLKSSDYPFLDHLSFIAGHELSVMPKDELFNELRNGTTQWRGKMIEADLEMLLDAASRSCLFSPKEKTFFL